MSGTALNDALALLDDVNENLATFDTKLLVMREDIAAIEVCLRLLRAPSVNAPEEKFDTWQNERLCYSSGCGPCLCVEHIWLC